MARNGQRGWEKYEQRQWEDNEQRGREWTERIKRVNREDWKRMIRDDSKRVIREDEKTINIDDENWVNKDIKREWPERMKRKLREDEENVIDGMGKKYRERINRIWTNTKKNENYANKKNVNRDEETNVNTAGKCEHTERKLGSKISRGREERIIIYDFLSTTTFKNIYCSTTGKPTHLFRTKCASLDSV